MQSSIGTRLLQIVPTILLVSVIVFALQHLLPGDPAVMLAGDSAGDPHVVAQIRDQLLLNRPLLGAISALARRRPARQSRL